MKKSKLKPLLIVALCCAFSTAPIFASGNDQELPNATEDGPDPPPTTPISDWVPLLAIAGIAGAGYYLTKRDSTATQV